MLVFAHPAWLLLLPLPALGLWASGRRRDGLAPGGGELMHPNVDGLGGDARLARPSPWPRRTRAAALALLLAALAQPQWLGPWVQRLPTGRDLLLLIDTSATMGIRDFQWQGHAVQRIDVLKALVTRFVKQRRSDRFGVIAFGSVAGTLVPPTFDRDLLTGMIARLQVGIAGQNTALGDAIALALKQLRQRGGLRPALILFSDGGDSNAGQMTTREAVALAQRRGVAIYTVAVNSVPDARGPAAAAPPEPVGQPDLRQIATLTGGRYAHAGSTAGLRAVIAAIGAREKTVARAPVRRVVRQWYGLPLGLAVVLLLAASLFARDGAGP